MKKYVIFFGLALLCALPAIAETGQNKPNNLDIVKPAELDNLPIPPEGKPTPEEVKFDKDSNDCYNSAEGKINKPTKTAGPNISTDFADPKSAILDQFYSECMKKKGYNLEEKSSEGETEE